jgi:hypothetical protein
LNVFSPRQGASRREEKRREEKRREEKREGNEDAFVLVEEKS